MLERRSQENVVIDVLAALDRLGIPYMVVGSMAVNYYGQPRFTHDLDLVARVAPKHVPGLLAAFGTEFYISEDGIRRALRTGSSFNAIHLSSGLKIDFWPVKSTDFDQSAFDRRLAVSYLGSRATLTAVEDLILKKLQWFKDSESEKHWRDAETVFRAHHHDLDTAYLDKWAALLSLEAEWQKLRRLSQGAAGTCREAVGKVVTAIHAGPWEAHSGPELTGVTGPEWYYSDAFLSLGDGSVLRLVCGETEVRQHLPANVALPEMSQDETDRCIGTRIVDVFKSDEPSAVVLLSNGCFLENAFLPGGSRLGVEDASKWSEDGPVEYVSLVTGATLTTAEFVRLAKRQAAQGHG